MHIKCSFSQFVHTYRICEHLYISPSVYIKLRNKMVTFYYQQQFILIVIQVKRDC